MCGFCDCLTEFLLPHFGINPGDYWYAPDNPVKEDDTARATLLLQGMQAGAVHPNEFRKVVQLDPLPDEENVLRYAGQLLGSADASQAEEDAASEDAANGNSEDSSGVPSGDMGSSGNVDIGGNNADGSSDTAKSAGDSLRRVKAVDANAIDPDTGLPRGMSPLINRLGKEIEHWYGQVTPELVQRIANGGAAELTDAHAAALQSIVDRYLPLLMLNGGVSAMHQVGVFTGFDVFSTHATDYVKQRGGELITSVPETYGNIIKNQIEERIPQGMTIEQAQVALIDALPVETTPYQAERIVRTEASMAWNEGQRQGWQQAGVEGKQWILGDVACPICTDLADQYDEPIPIDEPFRHEDWVGQSAPRHPNCRCYVTPVLAMPKGEPSAKEGGNA